MALMYSNGAGEVYYGRWLQKFFVFFFYDAGTSVGTRLSELKVLFLE